jgi:hypothetical protein
MRRDFVKAIAAAALVATMALPAMAGSLSPGNFNLWTTCGGVNPYDGSGGVIVPVGSSSCGTSYQAAQQNGGQSASGFQFYGCFKGGTSAPNGSNEESVFIADDVSSFTGHEMGFQKTLNDNALKAYLQTPGGGFYYTTLTVGDNGYHTYKCVVNTSNHNQVDYYIDGVYKASLNDGQNYYGLWYYMVGTTHRLSSGWNSSGEQIEMYSMQTF